MRFLTSGVRSSTGRSIRQPVPIQRESQPRPQMSEGGRLTSSDGEVSAVRPVVERAHAFKRLGRHEELSVREVEPSELRVRVDNSARCEHQQEEGRLTSNTSNESASRKDEPFARASTMMVIAVEVSRRMRQSLEPARGQVRSDPTAEQQKKTTHGSKPTRCRRGIAR